ncbi:hypothetical protein [Dorea formicigenerans]|uniref:DUF961 domain-containing protein n=1 Tax=Dorea formicigenerans TaxID=39486 RepID=A0A3E5EWZ9_9FIRM|nr:hypothetical protein [Dorea formicigenerans]RGN93348.1 hypothetical protein DXB36_03275 [Dorea formicigenerans]
MKKLSKFTSFDFEAFSEGKKYLSTGIQPMKDPETGNRTGTKVASVIIKDRTDYGISEDGTKVSNLFEKIVFKVPKIIDIPINVEIIPINPVAKVWGEFQNQLSVRADDIQVVSKQ